MKDTFQFYNVGDPNTGQVLGNPVRIEKVVADKPGGALISDPGFDVFETTAVGRNADGARFDVIKGYRLVAAVAVSDTTIKIAKGSGIVVGDFLGYGTLAVKSTALDQTNDSYDLVTITMGIAIASGEVLYQAAAASASAAQVIETPLYILGSPVRGGFGDQEASLIAVGTVRKETCCIGKDVAALLVTIKLV